MMLVYPAQIIGWLTGLAQRAIASGERVYEVLDSPLEMTEKPDAQPLRDAFGLTAAEFVAAGSVEAAGPTGSVTFDDVWFSYVDRPVLRGVSLEVPAGHTIALVGHTGCGKTTLTNLVPRFYDAGGGTVLIDGQDVRDLQLADLRRHIGIVNQDPFLFSTSIAENIRFGKPEASDDEVRAAARTAQADDFIEALPEGYETVIGERGFTLSGGQRQRIAIARALVMDPRILILDDATSSVDVETEFRIRAALQEVMRGRTTFIIAHRPSTISLAEEVIVLDHGRIEERGSHEDLMAAGGLYAHMFGDAEREGCCLDAAGEEEQAGGTGGHGRLGRGGLMATASRHSSGPHGSGASLEELKGWRAFLHLASELKLSRLARLAYPYRRRAVFSVVAMVVVTLSSLAVPYLLKVAIDGGIGAKDMTVLTWVIVAFIAVLTRQPRRQLPADVPHELGRRARHLRPAPPAVRPPAEAEPRLLQPAEDGLDRQPAHQRHRRARPARHRRRHDPGHQLADLHRRHRLPHHPRLAPRPRDPERHAVPDRGDAVVPLALGARPTPRCATRSAT